MQRIEWIDFLRGIAMILILIFHTEMYYKEYDATPYYVYTTNAIILFYFISGYLFYQNNILYLFIYSIVHNIITPSIIINGNEIKDIKGQT